MVILDMKIESVTFNVKTAQFSVPLGKYDNFDALWNAVYFAMMRHGYKLLILGVPEKF